VFGFFNLSFESFTNRTPMITIKVMTRIIILANGVYPQKVVAESDSSTIFCGRIGRDSARWPPWRQPRNRGPGPFRRIPPHSRGSGGAGNPVRPGSRAVSRCRSDPPARRGAFGWVGRVVPNPPPIVQRTSLGHAAARWGQRALPP
jgi:hypothetical protein